MRSKQNTHLIRVLDNVQDFWNARIVDIHQHECERKNRDIAHVRFEADLVLSFRLTNHAQITEAMLRRVPVLLEQMRSQSVEKRARFVTHAKMMPINDVERIHDPRKQIHMRLLVRYNAVARVVVKPRREAMSLSASEPPEGGLQLARLGRHQIREPLPQRRIRNRGFFRHSRSVDFDRLRTPSRQKIDRQEEGGWVGDVRVLRDELGGHLGPRLLAQNLLALNIALHMRRHGENDRRLHATEPAGQDRFAQGAVPASDHELVEALVPEETAGEVGSAGDGGEQRAFVRMSKRPVGCALDRVSVEERNSRDEVAESRSGDLLPFGGVGRDVENLVEFGDEGLTSGLQERVEFFVGKTRLRRVLSEEGVLHALPEGGSIIRHHPIDDNADGKGKREHSLDGNEVGVSLDGVGEKGLEWNGELVLGDGGKRFSRMTIR